MNFSCKNGIGAGLVVALLAVAAVSTAPVAPAHANAACDKLRAEFSGKLRPRVLRLAKKHFRNKSVAVQKKNSVFREAAGD